MFNKKIFLTGTALAIAAATAQAQVTTAGVSGQVTDESGAAISGATVTVINTDTGFARSTLTSEGGNYAVRNLPLGGSYTIEVSDEDFRSARVTDIGLSLGNVTDVDFALEGDEASRTLDTVVVSAQAYSTVDVATGPSATFGLETLESAPAINRNIVDVLRLDPRVYVDESRGDINPVQCGGKNPRFNSLTLDGVRLNDGFGLNSNGYPTERQPFPFDAIEAVAIELAPFDVEYGGFTACNINAVTKSGTNEFHGSLFFDYNSNDLQGSSLEGDDVNVPDFDEQRYGFQVGGPIIADTLFFSVAYEKLEGVNLFTRGPAESGAINSNPNLLQSELDEIVDIANTVYQYDPGEIPSGFDNEDEKLLVKLDWNITNNHRASFTYNYNDGFNTVASDGGFDEFEFSNHLYERGSELNQYVGFLYSDWTPNFSTEIRYGRVELDNRQESIGGTDFGEIQITTPGDITVYIGGDDSRQSNKLDYTIDSFAFKGFYTAGDHNLTFGYEREALDIFNLFVQHTETEIAFDSIEDFRDGIASDLRFNSSPSLNPQDAAADWGYAVDTLYLQDEWNLTDQFSLIVGLRYDMWSTDDAPAENATFLADYGFSNSQTLDGASLLQPRVAFNYDFSDELILRGGIGKYSGGDPNVWLSNTYSANNVLQFGQAGGSFGLTDGTRSLFDDDVEYVLCEDGVPTGPGWCVQKDLADAVASGVGSNFEINYLDPNFEIPSETKIAIGGTWLPTFEGPLGGEYVINADLLWSLGENSAIWKRGDLEQTGTTEEGYPIYDSVREPAFVLTNSIDGNESFTASVSIAKDYDFGLDWAFGYAYNDAKDASPMTSSVAFSNYTNRAFFDPQEDIAATSDYNVAHRFTLLVNYEKAFFGEYATKVSAFGTARSGLPYSLIREDSGSGFFSFTPFIGGAGVLRPGDQRNSEEGSWWGKVDLRLEQEFPGIRPEDRTSAFIVIDNFTNLLSDEWGVLREPGFPPNVRADVATGEIVGTPESRVGDASLWEVRLGVRYEF